MAEAVSLIINRQINELVLRCIKTDEVRHYYDIAVIGYGETAYSIFGGGLSGRDFVSPEELKDNPFKKIIVQEPKRMAPSRGCRAVACRQMPFEGHA